MAYIAARNAHAIAVAPVSKLLSALIVRTRRILLALRRPCFPIARAF
jgi:hypothetical protein